MRSSLRDDKGGGRIVHGSVSASGGIVGGTGFTVVKNATGVFTITFNQPLATPPIVALTPISQSRFVQIAGGSTGASFTAYFYNSALAAADGDFQFIAMEMER